MSTELMCELLDLWSEERCEVKLDFDGGFGAVSDCPWTVWLLWGSERDNPHEAEYVEYQWPFYGESIDEALAAALVWARGLLPFKACEECDGRGWWGDLERPVTCRECDGDGLANHPEVVEA